MSDHVKFYDYYIVEGPEVQALIESFEPISQKRSELIKEAMTLVEAVGWVDSQSFGDKGDKIQSFVWKADHKFPCEITISGYFPGANFGAKLTLVPVNTGLAPSGII